MGVGNSLGPLEDHQVLLIGEPPLQPELLISEVLATKTLTTFSPVSISQGHISPMNEAVNSWVSLLNLIYKFFLITINTVSAAEVMHTHVLH